MIIGAEKVLPEGSEYPDMSLLSLVADTIMVCSNTNDWDWQVMSPLMISGLFPHKDYVTKNNLVLWVQSNNFPILIPVLVVMKNVFYARVAWQRKE